LTDLFVNNFSYLSLYIPVSLCFSIVFSVHVSWEPFRLSYSFFSFSLYACLVSLSSSLFSFFFLLSNLFRDSSFVYFLLFFRCSSPYFFFPYFFFPYFFFTYFFFPYFFFRYFFFPCFFFPYFFFPYFFFLYFFFRYFFFRYFFFPYFLSLISSSFISSSLISSSLISSSLISSSHISFSPLLWRLRAVMLSEERSKGDSRSIRWGNSLKTWDEGKVLTARAFPSHTWNNAWCK